MQVLDPVRSDEGGTGPAGARLEVEVAITQRPPEPVPQCERRRGLARAHHPDEDEVVGARGRCHGHNRSEVPGTATWPTGASSAASSGSAAGCLHRHAHALDLEDVCPPRGEFHEESVVRQDVPVALGPIACQAVEEVDRGPT
jgi:hypothetical protein